MGSELFASESPKFKVKAAGSLIQKPGCPDYSDQALSQERLEKICNLECYNPSNERRKIDRIEICLLYTSPSPRDMTGSRMPSSA